LSTVSEPRFLLAGDAALVVEFGDQIDLQINRRVHVLARVLTERSLPGLGEVVPTYRSLLVHYDPLQLSCTKVKSFVADALAACESTPLPAPRLVDIPTVYGGDHGPDIAFVAEHNGLSSEDVIRLHSEATYTVYMLGFTPGFPYLGGLPDALVTPRLETPRKRVPAGSVGIAGAQTGVYSLATPGGWRLIGWTPVVLFDSGRTPPALLHPGDRVRFVPVEEAERGT
jgi:KipI family sensor histidine kinase inhibitor